MKLFLYVFLVLFHVFMVLGSTAETVNKHVEASKLSDLLKTIANSEKQNVQEIVDHIKNITINIQNVVNQEVENVKAYLGQMYEMSNMKMKRLIQIEDADKNLILKHQHKIESIISNGEKALKNCSENIWKDSSESHNNAQIHIKAADNYIHELQSVIANCNNSGIINTTCVIQRSQDSKNKITLDLVETRNDMREYLDTLPEMTKHFHECIARVSHNASSQIRRSERRIKHRIYGTEQHQLNK